MKHILFLLALSTAQMSQLHTPHEFWVVHRLKWISSGNSFIADVLGYGTEIPITARGLVCNPLDRKQLEIAFMHLTEAGVIVLHGVEGTESGITADVYIDGRPFDSVMVMDSGCEFVERKLYCERKVK